MPDYQQQADNLWYVCGSAKLGGIAIGGVLWMYLSHQKREAEKGNKQAAKTLILPAYLPLIQGLMVLLAIEAVFTLLAVTGTWDADNSLSWCVYEWIRDGFGMLFLQSNVSTAAFKRAAWMSTGWAAYGIFMGALLRTGLSDNTIYLYHAGVIAWYILVVTRIIPRRDSMLGYAGFMLTFRSSWLMYYLITNGVVTENLYYPLLVCIGCMELSLCFIWYLVLKTDTAYWRVGCFQALTTTDKTKRNILAKLEIGLLSDTADAVLGSDLPALIEANQQRMIDFAYIKFDESAKLLGQGAFSRVYRGMYQNKTPVALKFFVRLNDVTPESIALYAKETAIMAAVSNHDTIVTFYGLCVRPPTIFLVMEYCAKGSLFDVLRKEHAAIVARGPEHSRRMLLQMCLDVCTSIAYLHRIGYIHRDLKSLNYLVTSEYKVKLTDFGLSRQIKMGELTPASTDSTSAVIPEPTVLDTMAGSGGSNASGSGDLSRSSSGQRPASARAQQPASGGSSRDGSQRFGSVNSDQKTGAVVVTAGVYSSGGSSGQSSQHSDHASSSSSESGVKSGAHSAHGSGDQFVSIDENKPLAPAVAVKVKSAPQAAAVVAAVPESPIDIAGAEEYTRKVGSPYWMSPEMLLGDRYSEATDIYSVCVVMWEIWTGSTPYPDASRSQLKDIIVNRGERPPVPDVVPVELKRLMIAGWDVDTRKRPTAQALVDTLKGLLAVRPAAAAAAAAPVPQPIASAASVSGSRPPEPL